jgi:hypothetical protein
MRLIGHTGVTRPKVDPSGYATQFSRSVRGDAPLLDEHLPSRLIPTILYVKLKKKLLSSTRLIGKSPHLRQHLEMTEGKSFPCSRDTAITKDRPAEETHV